MFLTMIYLLNGLEIVRNVIEILKYVRLDFDMAINCHAELESVSVTQSSDHMPINPFIL